MLNRRTISVEHFNVPVAARLSFLFYSLKKTEEWIVPSTSFNLRNQALKNRSKDRIQSCWEIHSMAIVASNPPPAHTLMWPPEASCRHWNRLRQRPLMNAGCCCCYCYCYCCYSCCCHCCSCCSCYRRWQDGVQVQLSRRWSVNADAMTRRDWLCGCLRRTAGTAVLGPPSRRSTRVSPAMQYQKLIVSVIKAKCLFICSLICHDKIKSSADLGTFSMVSNWLRNIYFFNNCQIMDSRPHLVE